MSNRLVTSNKVSSADPEVRNISILEVAFFRLKKGLGMTCRYVSETVKKTDLGKYESNSIDRDFFHAATRPSIRYRFIYS